MILFISLVDNECDLYAHLEMVERMSWKFYGAPQDIWIKISGTEKGLSEPSFYLLSIYIMLHVEIASTQNPYL